MTHHLSTLAQQYFEAFEQAERPDGSRFWKRCDTCRDDDLRQLCFDAHGGTLPDDHRYQFIVDALAILADHEVDDALQHIEADCYIHA